MEIYMKASKMFKGTPILMAILLSTSAFAANKRALYIDEPVIVGGQQVPEGDYSAEWQGTGTNVEVTLTKNGKLITTVAAKWVTLDRASAYDSIVVINADGVRRLSQIRFAGKKVAIEIDSGASGDVHESPKPDPRPVTGDKSS
jgi:hypothetical protein